MYVSSRKESELTQERLPQTKLTAEGIKTSRLMISNESKQPTKYLNYLSWR